MVSELDDLSSFVIVVVAVVRLTLRLNEPATE